MNVFKPIVFWIVAALGIGAYLRSKGVVARKAFGAGAVGSALMFGIISLTLSIAPVAALMAIFLLWKAIDAVFGKVIKAWHIGTFGEYALLALSPIAIFWAAPFIAQAVVAAGAVICAYQVANRLLKKGSSNAGIVSR